MDATFSVHANLLFPNSMSIITKHHLKSKSGNDGWILKKQKLQKFELVQICIVGPLLGFTRLEHQIYSGIKAVL